MNFVRRLLNAAQEEGFEITVRCDGETDYKGFHPASAEEAINAVEEAEVSFHKGQTRKGWALIISGVADRERIADTSGAWINQWWEENVQ